jgi:hypothetical protein
MDNNYDVSPLQKDKLKEGAEEEQQIGEGSLSYERESMCDHVMRVGREIRIITEKRKAYHVRKERGHGFFSTDGMYDLVL